MASDNNQARANSLRQQISNLQQQISSTVNRINEVSGKIRRLEAAYRTIASLKTKAWLNKTRAASITHKSYKWKGQHRETFKSKGDSLVSEHNAYIKSLDNTMDNINYEITRLRNSLEEGWGAVGYLRSQIRNFDTEIRNLLN